jgi:hypothetical protein
MDLWMKLLFGNPIGILSLVTVVVSIGIVAFIATMLIRKSAHKK